MDAKVSYARKKNGEVMDVSLTFQGDGTKEQTAFPLLDSLLAGLSAVVLHEQDVNAYEQVDAAAFKSGWDYLSLALKGRFAIHNLFKEEVKDEGEVDNPEFNSESLLLAQACTPQLSYQGTLLWTDTETQIAFELPFGIVASSLVLEGTVTSIKESLLFLVLFVLIEEFGIDDECEFLPLIEKLVGTEVCQVEESPAGAEYFATQVQPWLTAFKTLN
jgi:hypothetical protein